MLSCSVSPIGDCNSDHNPVITTVRLKLTKLAKLNRGGKGNPGLLKIEMNIRGQYAVGVKDRFEVLQHKNTEQE